MTPEDTQAPESAQAPGTDAPESAPVADAPQIDWAAFAREVAQRHGQNRYADLPILATVAEEAYNLGRV